MEFEPTAGQSGPQQQLEDAWEKSRLIRLISSLPETQAEVLRLHYLGQLSFADVAATLDISEDAAKMRAARGRAGLRDLLDDTQEEQQ
mgnify:CR=1 FL=1